MGHFGCFWLFWGYRKWHFGCLNQNSKTTFRNNPRVDTLGPILDPRKAIFSHFVLFGEFLSFHGRGIFFLGKCMIFNSNSTQLNDILFFLNQGTTGKLFVCIFPITIAIEGIININKIFCHSIKSAKIAKNTQIQNFGSNSTDVRIRKTFPPNFYMP